MGASLEVLFTPAEFARLPERQLGGVACVVFDVLRATSSMMTALASGAREIVPVTTIEEAAAWRERDPGVVLAGERDGLRIRASQSGGVDFDLGNSPREFTPEAVAAKRVVMTTTNGTRALRACMGAERVLIGSFLGLSAVCWQIERLRPERLLVVCSGTFEEASFEDTLAAGALCDRLWDRCAGGEIADSAVIARQIYQAHANDLPAAMRLARNGRRLLSRPELAADVPFCVQVDTVRFSAEMGKDGTVRRMD